MPKPLYQLLIDAIAADIREGKLRPGQKVASEAALVKKFKTSRITVGRALRELQSQGLVERRAGSGTYVRAAGELPRSLLFGLLIPDLGETEIFGPICHGIANAPEAANLGLLWGHTDGVRSTKVEQCRQLCAQFLARQVSGVFFAPLEFEQKAEKLNREIVARLLDARIPVVLLDRRSGSKPERVPVDLVALHNRHAGYRAAEHLIALGSKRIGFLAQQGAASAIKDRLTGVLDALRDHDLPTEFAAHSEGLSHDPTPREAEAFVCANDNVAALFMQTFLARGVRIPEDVRLVGIDDATFARMLPVPLTTIRQPCHAIGEAALHAMLQRIERPSLPAREVLLEGELIVRRSCGST